MQRKVVSNEYKDILSKYGSVSFHGHEWTGISTDKHLDVVNATLAERKRYKDKESFPQDMYLLESVDEYLMMLKGDGSSPVYSVYVDRPNIKVSKSYNSIKEYLNDL